MTGEQALTECRLRLENAGIDDAMYESRCLVKKVLGLDRLGLISHGNETIDNSKATELFTLTQRRANGEPLQYILGSWSFAGFDFFVGEGVLIPRDDTEVVLSLCIDYLKSSNSKRTLDLCAGSGAISVALYKLADAEVTSVELSDKAFPYLTKNIEHNNADIKAFMGDIFSCYNSFDDGRYDLIVSNPPYIKTEEISTLQKEVQLEPKMALDGGADGYDFYRAIVNLWTSKLKAGGALAFELGEGQSYTVANLMAEKGFTNIKTALDLGGTKRAIIGIFNG